MARSIREARRGLWRGCRVGGRRTMRGTLLAIVWGLGVVVPAAAQPDPCQLNEARAVLAAAGRLLARIDDEGAAAGLRAAAQPPGECHEIGLAALAVDGWVEARRLAQTGAAPDELSRTKDTLARLESVRTARPRSALLSQLAAYADAVIRAAVAAAQDERDEMQVYLAHARTLADSLALARTGSPWPLPLPIAEGELWLEVDRFAEARAALSAVDGGPFAGRAALGLARALERLGDASRACAAYRKASTAPLAPASTDRARAGMAQLACKEP